MILLLLLSLLVSCSKLLACPSLESYTDYFIDYCGELLSREFQSSSAGLLIAPKKNTYKFTSDCLAYEGECSGVADVIGSSRVIDNWYYSKRDKFDFSQLCSGEISYSFVLIRRRVSGLHMRSSGDYIIKLNIWKKIVDDIRPDSGSIYLRFEVIQRDQLLVKMYWRIINGENKYTTIHSFKVTEKLACLTSHLKSQYKIEEISITPTSNPTIDDPAMSSRPPPLPSLPEDEVATYPTLTPAHQTITPISLSVILDSWKPLIANTSTNYKGIKDSEINKKWLKYLWVVIIALVVYMLICIVMVLLYCVCRKKPSSEITNTTITRVASVIPIEISRAQPSQNLRIGYFPPRLQISAISLTNLSDANLTDSRIPSCVDLNNFSAPENNC